MIQHRLGHSTARLSLELYAHVSEAADRAAAAHLDALFPTEPDVRGTSDLDEG